MKNYYLRKNHREIYDCISDINDKIRHVKFSKIDYDESLLFRAFIENEFKAIKTTLTKQCNSVLQKYTESLLNPKMNFLIDINHK
jgi:hypothetical protein